MAEKVARLGIARDDADWLYTVRDAAVWRVRKKRPGVAKGAPEKIADLDCELAPDYTYFLDGDGDVSRSPRPGAQPRPRPALRGRRGMSHTTLCALRAEPFERYRALGRELPRAQWEELLARGAGLGSVEELRSSSRPGHVVAQGAEVALSGLAACVLLDLCLAECEAAAHEIGGVDFFFADLEASPPPRAALAGDAHPAWDKLLDAVDTSGIRRRSLPWWLHEAARARDSCAGLLDPHEVAVLGEHLGAIAPWLATSLNPTHREDAAALLELVRQAAAGGHWVLGWEPGT
jgi:hypothetical protein